MDERVATTRGALGAGSDTRRFVYAPDGRVLGEYGASASDVKAEFIWMSPEGNESGAFGGDDGLGGYMPLAVAVPTATAGMTELNWVHSDHLGVPIWITNASGMTIAQSSSYTAPAFPGQSRTLADLYYNKYRDYDPTTGRYIQADPIGLAGGTSPYSYAMNNPLRYTDPTGEFVPAVIACAANPLCRTAALAGAGFVGDLAYQAGMNWWNGRDVFDRNCYDLSEAAMSGGLSALGGGLGGKALTNGLGRLSNGTKGNIGEALSVGWNRLKGSSRLDQKSIDGFTTKPDSVWRSLMGDVYYVESKFGKSSLTGPQRRALNELGPDIYHVERWTYDFFSRAGTGAGAITGGVVGANVGE